ncbi:hypothetical protein GIB67_035378 [Kingdonia uniflora]|uniref:Uncharacterized protein n=1 Tax=Kingdonia uniflora TaxID=39325 RepID=A0A7J7MMC9_9MAGN|nr:hypothetical protein GIB67_035378 [Kingdonia uniflora]
MNGDRVKPHAHSTYRGDQQVVWAQPDSHRDHAEQVDRNHIANVNSIHVSLRKSLAFFVRLTSKFPLIFIFFLIILYAIPASGAILVLYIVITAPFALSSALILYFAYPSLDWLVREIVT